MKLRATSVVAGFSGNQYLLAPSCLTNEPFCDMPADGLYDVYTFEWGGGHLGSRQGRWQLTARASPLPSVGEVLTESWQTFQTIR